MFFEFLGRDPHLETGKVYFLMMRSFQPFQAGGIVANIIDLHNKPLWSKEYGDYTTFKLNWGAA
jgi:hypothetical protein